jgi:metallo-beta-lactamase class B VIM
MIRCLTKLRVSVVVAAAVLVLASALGAISASAVVAAAGGSVAFAGEAVAAEAPSTTPRAPREWRTGDLLLVTELAPGIWRHVSWREIDGQRVPSNGLVVRDGDEIVIVDTAWGEEPTVALLDWVQAEIGKPVARVIATHSHEDRVGAPRTLAERGIPLLVHPKTAEIVAQRGVTTTQPLPGFADADAVRVGGLEVFYPGAAHTRDNVVVWIPSARVLVGGCAVKSADARDLGYVAEADLASWPGAMRKVRERYGEAAIVVPGHGEPGDLALLDHTVELVASGGEKGDGG